MHDNPLRVSVVMCTHNGMAFIEEQLESILNQTYTPYELIVSDDDSTDGTLDFVIEYIDKFKNQSTKFKKFKFQVIQNKPALGVTKNFEKAILSASGDLIALCDQDDIWVKDKLQIISEQFVYDNNLFLVNTNAQLIKADGRPLGYNLFDSLNFSDQLIEQINSGNAIQHLIKRNLVTGATSVFRKELVFYSLPFPENWLHDEWLAINAALNGRNGLRTLGDITIKYRQHSENVVGAKKLGLRDSIGRVIFPRKERNEILLARSRELLDHCRLRTEFEGSKAIELCEGKYFHEVFRTNLPASRAKRLKPIIGEIKKGRYKQYGLGFKDCIRDFLQPV